MPLSKIGTLSTKWYTIFGKRRAFLIWSRVRNGNKCRKIRSRNYCWLNFFCSRDDRVQSKFGFPPSGMTSLKDFNKDQTQQDLSDPQFLCAYKERILRFSRKPGSAKNFDLKFAKKTQNSTLHPHRKKSWPDRNQGQKILEKRVSRNCPSFSVCI